MSTTLCLPTFGGNAGSRENPAQLCDDIIAMKQENMSDGLYWIDPNAGCIRDAVQVFCNAFTRETCITSHNNSVSILNHFCVCAFVYILVCMFFSVSILSHFCVCAFDYILVCMFFCILFT